MVDIVDKNTRSRMMAGIRGRNTKPEITVRQFLHSRGFRYRLHVNSLPGRPDLVLPKYKLVIFIHGCFWHQHSGCRYATIPDENREKWQEKFLGNVKRDHQNIEKLKECGWRIIVIWECALRTIEGRNFLNLLPEMIMNANLSIFEWPTYGELN